MKAISLCDGWRFSRVGEEDAARPVVLPHDAMLGERRSATAPSGTNSGWFEGRDYVYTRVLEVPGAWREQQVMLEFEGVYRNAEVWVDGRLVARRPYGYADFFMDLSPHLRFGGQSELRVVARNAEQPNSRWYTGAGIYRPVVLWTGPRERYLPPGAIRVATLGIDPPRVRVDVATACAAPAGAESPCAPTLGAHGAVGPAAVPGAAAAASASASAHIAAPEGAAPEGISPEAADPQGASPQDAVSQSAAPAWLLEVEVRKADGRVLARQVAPLGPKGSVSYEMDLPDAPLWSPDAPVLLSCHVALKDPDGVEADAAATGFGIRELAWSAERGLTLNGERVILRGACDHHTNGILGAAAYPEAEERKVRLLRDAGYNAIRSAHNPASNALLSACDRLGMLVVDEYADQWYIHKTRYDYASDLPDWWERDLAGMVEKDFNHPCVIMYSLGNEVSETAEPRGVELARAMAGRLHGLDPTRPVTCGINIFFNGLSTLGLGVYTDEKAERAAQTDGARPAPGGHGGPSGSLGTAAALAGAAGSQFYNTLAGLFGAGFMKAGARLPLCDAATRDAFAELDIAGYNYGIDRYAHDLRAYPERLILGTETFCADAFRFWELARREPRLVGDFVWAGLDYLGETALGAWEYADYAGNFSGAFGWIAAGQGRLDLTGKAGCETLCTRVAFELDEGPYLGVCPVNHTGERHSPSAWRASNAIASWSWEGCEGRLAHVEVYSRAPLVRLVLNGRTVAVKTRPAQGCVTRFACRYAPGELTAVALDRHGRELGRASLRSASGPTELRAEPEAAATASGRLAFVRLRLTDAAGEVKPLERRVVHVVVEGGELVALGHGCPYNEVGYLRDCTDTYFGEALAVLRAGGPGPVCLRAWTRDGLEARAEVQTA